MDPEVQYQPVDRTPADYQTVIKLLLVASLLDATSLWADGTPRAARGMARDMEVELPLATQQALQQLGVAKKDWPSSSLRSPSIVVRVFSLLFFNTIVLWTDVGSVFLHTVNPSLTREPLRDISAETVGLTCWRNASGLSFEISAIHADFECDSACFGDAVENEIRAADDNVTVDHVSVQMDDGSCLYFASWAHSTVSRVLKGALEAFLSCDSAEGVPWFAQLMSLALLVLVVHAVPRCPIVLESACNFLMC